ncbi:hypothetical protein D0Z08_19875 [Nocardioides immobilis]|uniref:Uncharacterized protein n=1 Tax=Nocardioides immobilis TaxID=2049295 RepID=A0A417XXG1_9ACTN|nr:hypothetical protein [Nocardioides immobilis]RHW25224.1 hypothetical protein D0Z08_19875 [Nocardioides immobilis]
MADDDSSDDRRQPAELLRLMSEHPGMEAVQLGQGVRRSLEAVRGNADELVRWIDLLNQGNAGMLIMAQGGIVEPGDGITEYLDELSRLWHNFIASAMTLVTHVTRVRKKQSAEFQAAYDQARQELLSDPVVAFVQGLRNYWLHKWTPSNFVRMKFGRDAPLTYVVGCASDALLEEWEWTAPQRVYLQERDEFVLRDSVIEYVEHIDHFYEWFKEAYHAEHAEAFESLTALEGEYDEQVPQPAPVFGDHLPYSEETLRAVLLAGHEPAPRLWKRVSMRLRSRSRRRRK